MQKYAKVHQGIKTGEREREIYARRPCIVLQRGIVGRVPWCNQDWFGGLDPLSLDPSDGVFYLEALLLPVVACVLYLGLWDHG